MKRRTKDLLIFVIPFGIIMVYAVAFGFISRSSILQIFFAILSFFSIIHFWTRFHELTGEIKEARIKKIKEEKPKLDDWEVEAEYKRRWEEREKKTDKFGLIVLIVGLFGLFIFGIDTL